MAASERGPQPKSHHFVHRAYLEGFIDPATLNKGEGRLWVYMPGKSPFPQRPERVAKRNYYYCLNEESKRDFQVETALAQLEDAALPILRNIRAGNFVLSADDRLTFAGYIALTFTRVPSFERSINRVSNLMMAYEIEAVAKNDSFMRQAAEEHFQETGEKISADEFRRMLTSGSVELKQTNRGWSIKMMFQSMLRLQLVIADMQWAFLQPASVDDPGFVTTDNPVALFDTVGNMGGMGFASSKEAHFAFPISRSLCLVARHTLQPIRQRLTPANVREVNSNVIRRCDRQVYAPFESTKLQRLLDEVVANKTNTGRVFFRKGRLVEE